MQAKHSEPLSQVIPPGGGTRPVRITRIHGSQSQEADDLLAVEEPLEIRILHGHADSRQLRSISVTMRTPGNDAELAAGFLLSEGVLADEDAILAIHQTASEPAVESEEADSSHLHPHGNTVTVELHPDVVLATSTLERNFYTTSSCGICGKASLLALRTVCPPRRPNTFTLPASVLTELPGRLRAHQGIFDRTGGLHAAALFSAAGELDSTREDVGRHNAVDKLLGAAFLAGRTPLRDRLLLLSGRASFELLQKALMAGIPMVASVGAPSSLAVRVARDFDITLVGFLRDDHFNLYHAPHRVTL